MPCARPHHYGGPAAGRTCSDRERCEGGLAPHRPLVDEARRGAEKERQSRGHTGALPTLALSVHRPRFVLRRLLHSRTENRLNASLLVALACCLRAAVRRFRGAVAGTAGSPRVAVPAAASAAVAESGQTGVELWRAAVQNWARCFGSGPFFPRALFWGSAAHFPLRCSSSALAFRVFARALSSSPSSLLALSSQPPSCHRFSRCHRSRRLCHRFARCHRLFSRAPSSRPHSQ